MLRGAHWVGTVDPLIDLREEMSFSPKGTYPQNVRQEDLITLKADRIEVRCDR